MKLNFLILILQLIFCSTLFGQNKDYSHFLDSISPTVPALNQHVDISVSDMEIKEFVRLLGNSTGLNITVDPMSGGLINTNFNGVSAKNVINYLCSNYNLILSVYGEIIHLQPIIDSDKKLSVQFNHDDLLLSYIAERVPAEEFFRELTIQTNINFLLNPEIRQFLINGFAQQISLENALIQIGSANRLLIKNMNSDLYNVNISVNQEVLHQIGHGYDNINFSYSDGLISAEANNTQISGLIASLDKQSNYNCHILSPIDETITLNIKNYDLLSFLNYIFIGTKQTYKIDGQSIFFGRRELAEIKSCELIRLNNRRVDSLSYVLPDSLKRGLTIQEFYEQNSFIVWGEADKIFRFKQVIKEIDKPVPVILIDVIIVDSSENFGLETSLEVGLGEKPTITQGTINEGINLNMGANSVNNLIGRVGLSNLGKVTPNFYVRLKALETENVINIRSTPQLSTLNGHTASLSIGQTEYYQEETSNIWGTQNPQLIAQTQYKPVEAKLQIIIKPFVTGNGQVSLDINVIQSEFTSRVSEYAPPGLVSREFKSKISVKNQDMILLGGLQEQNHNVNKRGLPLIARVPVLKWFFASHNDSKGKSNLNIFIKPTVFY